MDEQYLYQIYLAVGGGENAVNSFISNHPELNLDYERCVIIASSLDEEMIEKTCDLPDAEVEPAMRKHYQKMGLPQLLIDELITVYVKCQQQYNNPAYLNGVVDKLMAESKKSKQIDNASSN